MSSSDFAVLTAKVTPRSSRNTLAYEEGQLKIWVTAPPTDGSANEAVIELLAKKLGCAPSRVTLVSGATSRQKKFRIGGLSQDAVHERLTSH